MNTLLFVVGMFFVIFFFIGSLFILMARTEKTAVRRNIDRRLTRQEVIEALSVHFNVPRDRFRWTNGGINVLRRPNWKK